MAVPCPTWLPPQRTGTLLGNTWIQAFKQLKKKARAAGLLPAGDVRLRRPGISELRNCENHTQARPASSRWVGETPRQLLQRSENASPANENATSGSPSRRQMSEVLKNVVTVTLGPDTADFCVPHQTLYTVKLTPDSLATPGTTETSVWNSPLKSHKAFFKKEKKTMAAKPRDSCAPRHPATQEPTEQQTNASNARGRESRARRACKCAAGRRAGRSCFSRFRLPTSGAPGPSAALGGCVYPATRGQRSMDQVLGFFLLLG